MSGFSNPVSNAAGTLVRAVLKSVNFVAGLAGWQVTREGDAEFNNVNVRGIVFGSLQATSPNETDAIITSSVTGDAFSRLQILAGGNIHFGDGSNPQDVGIGRNGPGVFQVDQHLTVVDGLDVGADTVLNGTLTVNNVTTFTEDVTINGTANNAQAFLLNGAVLHIDGFDQGKGIRQYTALNSTTSLGTTETPIATLASMTYEKGRVYEIRVTAGITVPSGGVVLLKVRKGTGTSGTLWTQSGNIGVIASQLTRQPVIRMANYTAADITTAVTLIGLTSTGTGSFTVPDDNPTSGSRRIRVEIRDIGSTADYTDEPAIS